ncbi:MAG TPA: hypothetical protein VLK22_00170 [Candidatus Udaeobacter sp.]|nr:hypothetical protein [Candidatus Udaeobacter sp.]
MPRKVEVIVSSRSSSYTTTHLRAQQARAAAEAAQQLQELERSGELRRRELVRSAEQFKEQVLNLASHCPHGTDADSEFRDQVRALAARPIPTQVDGLERWVNQMPLLISTLKAEVEDRKQRAERERQAEEEFRKETLRQMQIEDFKKKYLDSALQALYALRHGFMPLIDAVLISATAGLIEYGMITELQGDQLEEAWIRQVEMDKIEERYGDFADRYYRMTKDEMIAIESKYHGVRKMRRGHDGDQYKKHRHWNRWRVAY